MEALYNINDIQVAIEPAEPALVSPRDSLEDHLATQEPDARPKQRRNRKQTSCVACHSRKQKCDARDGIPCANCVKRNVGPTCYVAPVGASKQDSPDSTTKKPRKKAKYDSDAVPELQARIQQLENALRHVGQNPTHEASDAELVTSALGQLAAQNQNTSNFSDSRVFVGRGSMADMMRSVEVVGPTLHHPKKGDSNPAHILAMGCFATGNVDKQLVANLPSDSLAPLIINSYIEFQHILMPYGVQFDGTIYGQYYKLRNETPTIDSYARVSLLYICFAYGVLYADLRDNDHEKLDGCSRRELRIRYAALSKAALMKSEYMEPPSLDLIQTMIMQGIYAKCEGRPSEDYHIISHAIRIAQSMGMHRETSKASGIDAVEDSRRRKIWYSLYHIDRMLSISFGRPYTISDRHCDVKEEGPLEGFLQIELARVLGDVIDECCSPKSPSYDTIIEFDKRFQKIEQQIFNDDVIEGSAEDGFKKHKIINCAWARCVLHRPYLLSKPNPDGTDPYAKSKFACIIISQKIINLQQDCLSLLPRKFWNWPNFAYRILDAAVTLCVAILQDPSDKTRVERLDPWVLQGRSLLLILSQDDNIVAQSSLQALDYIRNKYALSDLASNVPSRTICIPYVGLLSTRLNEAKKIDSNLPSVDGQSGRYNTNENRPSSFDNGSGNNGTSNDSNESWNGTIMTLRPLDIDEINTEKCFKTLPLPDGYPGRTTSSSGTDYPTASSNDSPITTPSNFQPQLPNDNGDRNNTNTNGATTNMLSNSLFDFDFESWPSVYTYFNQVDNPSPPSGDMNKSAAVGDLDLIFGDILRPPMSIDPNIGNQ